ncbi:hypothetical protein KKC08_04995, partial [Patescibacteria group bacterium]|nr:hypothetical protein [Patescibacteria group bacterium]
MKKSFLISIFLVSILYLSLRLYKLPQKMTFHLDQGLHLLETYNMVKNKKPRLIGPMVSSKTFDGRGFFIGPNYYYILATLGIISNWNPVTILVLLIII